MGFGPAVIANGAAGVVGQSGGEAGVNQGLQRLVHRGQADIRELPPHRREDLLGGGVYPPREGGRTRRPAGA